MTEQPITTIQQTAKRYKLMQIIGAAACALGVVWAAIAIKHGASAAPGLAVACLGLAYGLIGKLLAWWHHG